MDWTGVQVTLWQLSREKSASLIWRTGATIRRKRSHVDGRARDHARSPLLRDADRRPAMPERRRFPPPWSVEELDACFIVKDSDG
jgi:hypothetical protein